MKREFRKDNLVIIFEDIHFSQMVKNHLSKQCTETGGILCGSYSKNLFSLKVTEVCGPAADSQFGHSSFVRGIRGLAKKLSQDWRKGAYYVGEWHLHPYSSAEASAQDRRQIIENSKDKNLKCPEPIMIIVGMQSNEFCFKVYGVFKGEIIELHESSYKGKV